MEAVYFIITACVFAGVWIWNHALFIIGIYVVWIMLIKIADALNRITERLDRISHVVAELDRMNNIIREKP